MKGFGNFAQIMKEAQKQAQVMQKKMEEMQRELKERVVEGSSGGGMVTAKMNGRQELLSVKIDPEVVDPKDVEMLEDLVAAAVNQASKKSQELYEQEMAKLTGGLNIPGLPGLPFGKP
ncbi:MAG TPA: YbaB/EbfC family nucleoid-associated protein [Candidatus Avalokitesvara rifleensis]|jgi:DNA-binding YbaB/EbfC family protein|uniref:YbaB/EbfC family nucleoid-associated protein n=1 Tax=Candidatus Avalokitesvara rifleensis TaxID=3367620 RepID=UPI002712E9F1|nr:YbaB/EbfC family nucleoid-associated protein [Candidatus Brocadiales bacterium]